MHLNVIGLNHATAPVEIRDQAALTSSRQTEVLSYLKSADELLETVVLSTCNRSEIYATTNGIPDGIGVLESWFHNVHEQSEGMLSPYLYRKTDRQAVHHLFRVVGSLDSMVVGEQQILGQVKEAYHRSLNGETTGLILNHLFERALEVGKRIRERTAIGTGSVSVSSIAVTLANKIFKTPDGLTAMLIGAGETAELTARYLMDSGVRNIVVTNRTYERAVDLATKINGQAVPFDEYLQWIEKADIIISSTGAPDFILHRQEMDQIMKARRKRPIFLIDIAAPRDIDPDIRQIYNVFLYDIDDLQSVAADNTRRRQQEAEKAEQIVKKEVETFFTWYDSLTVTPTIKGMRDQAALICDAEVERTLSRLSHLSEKDRKAIKAMSHAIVNKFLHNPTVRLKAQDAPDQQFQYASTIRYLFDLDA